MEVIDKRRYNKKTIAEIELGDSFLWQGKLHIKTFKHECLSHECSSLATNAICIENGDRRLFSAKDTLSPVRIIVEIVDWHTTVSTS